MLVAITAAGFLALNTSPANAQDGMAGSLSGFQSDSDQPISIEADTLEVRDAQQTATFTGNVLVVQGDVELRTTSLRVFYDGQQGGSETNQQIRRMETLGPVVITTSEQEARGDRGIFEADKDIVRLEGDVVLTQGDNVLRGTQLVVDLKTGTSRVYSRAPTAAQSSGRVRALLQPRNGEAGAAPATAPTAASPAPTAPQQPAQQGLGAPLALTPR